MTDEGDYCWECAGDDVAVLMVEQSDGVAVCPVCGCEAFDW